ncbi:cellulose synthase complex periplasmic endoglucanase BcsZ [Chromobacterium alticapitis]|uniref:cellulase n=1 Tax=Chromobacterium alticapitis TaxID=2073169 RepID=A0A2S5DIS0_9NEIS|nr:cellulose synthase complex periplasmic endoglucanase BcsZ [Chromobacterium alticapitis]POZ62892.1 cellulase [Chromobacterium alticapitis]
MRLPAWCAGLLCALPLLAQAEGGACDGWPQWRAFSGHFLSPDGRVIDPGREGGQTTSEGQSYGLFFALVANDRQAFERMLAWTRDNLAAGDLAARLPAWLWGRKKDGSWGVLDDNSAADSDMWIAYDLLEAGRLWREPRYAALGRQLALRILEGETADLPGLGPTLLPGRVGFHHGGEARLNPSYLPPQLVARLGDALPDTGWGGLRHSTARVLLGGAPAGFAPDWLAYHPGKGLALDEESKAQGSYGAIRVYLWAGMLAPDAPLRAELLQRYRPMAHRVAQSGEPPEQVDSRNGQAAGSGPAGFSAAMLPMLQALGDQAALQAQLRRIASMPERPDAYYDHVLMLFGLGWQQARYRFAANGAVLPAWEGACPASHTASP